MKRIIAISLFFLVGFLRLSAPSCWRLEIPVNKEINRDIESRKNYLPAASNEDKASVDVLIKQKHDASQTNVFNTLCDIFSSELVEPKFNEETRKVGYQLLYHFRCYWLSVRINEWKDTV